jgi:hypothetical protein
MLPLWTATVLAGWITILLLKPTTASMLSRVLTVTSCILVAVSISNVIMHEVFFSDRKEAIVSSQSSPLPTVNTSGMTLPDIYYIVLDGYGSKDTLETAFQFDNSEFYNYLEDKGFYIAHKSHSNYGNTHQSIPSSLNMTYLDHLAEIAGPKSTDPKYIRQLVETSSVFSRFKSLGYKIVVIGRCTFEREYLKIADSVDICDCGVEFRSVLWQNTVLSPLIDRFGGEAYRQSILCQLSELGNSWKIKGPKFVFAHLMLPHPPYCFGPSGEERSQAVMQFNTYQDNSGYTDQVQFVNQKIRTIVDTIIHSSGQQPIIVLQGDHGPQVKDVEEFLDRDVDACKYRLGILSAYFVPEGVRNYLYDSITPVNTFRLILSRGFGTDDEMLEDKSYVTKAPYLYEFDDVTSIVAGERRRGDSLHDSSRSSGDQTLAGSR